MRRPAVLLGLGSLLLISAVAGFVIVPEHRPRSVDTGRIVGNPFFGETRVAEIGWARPVYDAALITTWAGVIVGVILVALGFIVYVRRGE